MKKINCSRQYSKYDKVVIALRNLLNCLDELNDEDYEYLEKCLGKDYYLKIANDLQDVYSIDDRS